MKKSFITLGPVLPVSINSSVKNFTRDIFHKQNIFRIFIPAIKIGCDIILLCLFDLILLHLSQQFFSHVGMGLPGLNWSVQCTKQRIKCLAQGHNTVKLEPANSDLEPSNQSLSHCTPTVT